MYVREQIGTVTGQLLELEKVLCAQARKHQGTVMPGYTHLQRAQPVSFAQHLLAYAAQFSRDVTRLEDCKKRLNECPLGSGALARGQRLDRLRIYRQEHNHNVEI